MALRRFINLQTGLHNPAMVGEIGRLIGQPIIKDIAFTHCRVESDLLDDNTVSRLFLAHVYPNDIHITDVCFQDPFQPLPAGQRRYEMQTHKGLGLLTDTMARIEAHARGAGCDHITLTAAGDDNMALFKRYGFTVEKNPVGKSQNAMEKKLK
jgi:hypothetical protein